MSDSRFGSVGSILNREVPPRPRLVPEPDAEPTDREADAAPQPTHAETATPQRPRKTPLKVSPTNGGGSVRVTARFKQLLRDRLAERARQADIPYAAVVFEAIEAAHADDRLTELVQALEAKPHTQSGLFDRPATRGKPEPTIPVEMSMTATNRKVLDKLVDETGASSRTALMTAALCDYLEVAP